MSELLTMQDLANGHLDVKALGEAANGDENTIVTTRTGNTYPSAERAINIMFKNGGLPATPFATKALMTASALADGKYAQVTDETANNGLYVKTAGNWIKSAYDPIVQAKGYTDSLVNTGIAGLPYTVIDSEITAPTSAGTNRLFSATAAKTALIKVNPSTKYTIEKSESSRFRIIEFATLPVNSVTMGYVTKSDDISHILHVDSFENVVEAFTLTTRADTQYLAVNISANSEPTPDLQIKAGDAFDFISDNLVFAKDAVYDGAKLSNVKQIKIGKNKFDGSYLQDTAIFGAVSSTYIRPLSNEPNALTSVIKIKPNTTYTISKTASTRFRIALAKYAPVTGKSTNKLIADIDNALSYTFTSGALDRYLLIYLSNNNIMPEFVQVEEGAIQTSWETYGYSFKDAAKPIGGGNGNPADLSGYVMQKEVGAGNANYIEKLTAQPYTNSSKSVVATDDTAALQALFDKGGVVRLNGKQHKVSGTIAIDLSKVKKVHGNGATFVTTSDNIVLDIFGEMTTNAGPENSTAQQMLSAGRIIKGLRITSASGVVGQAVRLRNTNKLDIDVEAYFMRDGVSVDGVNRNLRLRPKAYGIIQDGLRFGSTCNLHQSQIYIGDMSYCNKIMHFDDPEIYNMQVIGGDYELGLYNPTTTGAINQHSILHMRSATNTIDDVIFSGVTFEAHYAPQRLIKLEGAGLDSLRAIEFSGCHFGNADQDIFEIQGVAGLKIDGVFRNYKGYAFNFLGAASGVKINALISSSALAAYGGGVLKSVGSHYLTDVKLDFISNGANRNPVLLDCNIDGFICSNNIIGMSGLTNFDDTKGIIDINASSRAVRNLKVNDNILKLPSAVTHNIRVAGAPGRIKIKDNDSNKAGAYPTATASIIASDNYAPTV